MRIKANDIGLLYQVLGCLIRSGDKAEAAALNALLERLEMNNVQNEKRITVEQNRKSKYNKE